MSDSERNQKRRIHKCYRSKSPVILDSREADEISLSSFREMCDFCLEPQNPGEPMLFGRAVTHVNADKEVHLRDLAELALKFYNDIKLNSFKLVKVCKINRVSCGYYGLTFRAQEDGTNECHVFRGVVHKKEALFCEIKDDDAIKLLPDDDDYVSSERACESEDCPPCEAKNDLGDGSAADSGDSSITS